MASTYAAVMAATTFLVLAWIYFYALYRERYMGIWIIGWTFFFARIALLDYGSIDWKNSLLIFSIYQASIIVCSLLFLWGIFIFINRPMKRYWPGLAAGAFLISEAAAILDLPMYCKLAPSAWFAGVVLVYIGTVFVWQVKIRGIGSAITGYAHIVWGVLTLVMPFTLAIPWLSPWCYLTAGLSRMVIALGILIVYFEKERAELAARESKYRLLAENAVDAIYHYKLRPATGFEYISPSIRAFTGYPPKEYYQNEALLLDSVHPDDQALFAGFIKSPSPSNGLPLTFRIVRKDGSVIWVEQKCVILHGLDGRPAALEGIIRDITARKNTEDLLFRAEKMNLVGQMAVSMAHEIRNPLTSVRGFLQLLGKKAPSEQARERYTLMIRELDRANAIISEYLLLAKDKVPDRKPCCLNLIITQMLPLLQTTAEAAGISIRPDLADVPALLLDDTEIRQLLLNLFNNGLEAMPQGGELVIRTAVEQDKVILTISDQGSGIPPHILGNLGTPFLTTKDTGTGLGLSICYRIASRHGAAISVETNNRGTSFHIRFSKLCPEA